MLKIFFLSLMFVGTFLIQTAYSQNLQKSKYVVMTFEEEYAKSLHGAQRYFWIIPVDSIKSYQNNLYPFYESGVTKSQYSDCSSGLSIDPSIPSLKSNDYEYDSVWYASHDRFTSMIYKNRKLVQTIKKTWTHGNKATINIYATPIFAEFCSCDLAYSGQKRYDYSGKIYLAGNFHENYGEFWESDLAKFIYQQDYSTFNFKQMRYPK